MKNIKFFFNSSSIESHQTILRRTWSPQMNGLHASVYVANQVLPLFFSRPSCQSNTQVFSPASPTLSCVRFHPYSCLNSCFTRVHLHFSQLTQQTKRPTVFIWLGCLCCLATPTIFHSVEGPQVVFCTFSLAFRGLVVLLKGKNTNHSVWSTSYNAFFIFF